MANEGLEIPIVATQRQFNRAMRDVLTRGGATAEQVRKEFAKANPQATAQFERFVRGQELAVDRLAQRLDPAVRATRQYEIAQEQLKLSVQSGAVSQERANVLLDQARIKYLGAANSTRAMAQASAQASVAQRSFLNVSRGGRFMIQNTANQVGDMAVQLSMGTDAMRVMGLQMPQLLGGFVGLGGALGTLMPILGTLAAIGFPVAAAFLATRNGAGEAEDQIRTFTERLNDAEAAIRRADEAAMMASAEGLAEVRDRFGEVTVEIQNMLDELAGIENRAARLELQDLIGEALGEDFASEMDRIFGAVGSAIVTATDEGVALAQERVADLEAQISNLQQLGQTETALFAGLSDELVTAREELAALEGDFANIGALGENLVSPGLLQRLVQMEDGLRAAVDAGRFADAVVMIDRMRSAIEQAGQESGEITGEMQAVLDALTRVQAPAQEFANNMGQTVEETGKASQEADALAAALSQISGSDISGVADQAMVVAESLGMAADEASRFVATWAQVASLGGAPSTGVVGFEANDPRNPGFDAPIFDGPSRTVTNWTPPSASGSSGRGGGGGGSSRAQDDIFASTQREIETLERRIELIGATAAETAELETRQQLLNTARERGLNLDAVQAETGRTLRDEIDQQAASVARLTEQYEGAAEEARFWSDQSDDLREGFLDAIIEGENFRGVLEDVARAIARAAIQASLFGDGPLSNMFGGGSAGGSNGGGFLGGGLLGSLFGGFRANGGPVQAGKIYAVNENTPRTEYFAPGVDGMIYNPQQMAGMAGGRSEILVRLAVTEGVSVAESYQIAGDIAVRVVSESEAARVESDRRTPL